MWCLCNSDSMYLRDSCVLCIVRRMAAHTHYSVVCGTARDKKKATKAEVLSPFSFIYFLILNLAGAKDIIEKFPGQGPGNLE